MLGWLSSIKESIVNLGSTITQGIIDGISAIFVPQEDYLSEKYQYVQDKFNFLWDIIDIIESILSSFNAFENVTEPPSVEIDLSANNSKYNWGGSALVLDLSWYAPYKPTVDIFLRSILWIFFLWRLFVHLPSIINGVSGSTDVLDINKSSVPMITKKGR